MNTMHADYCFSFYPNTSDLSHRWEASELNNFVRLKNHHEICGLTEKKHSDLFYGKGVVAKQ